MFNGYNKLSEIILTKREERKEKGKPNRGHAGPIELEGRKKRMKGRRRGR